MAGPLIAVVGSYDPERVEALDLKHLDRAPTAAEDLGRELARQGRRIVVYSDMPHTLEIDLVRGYASVPNLPQGVIQVLYSKAWYSKTKKGRPTFAEEAGQDRLFDFRPDFNTDWEFSFYQSLGEVDGLVLLGGGTSSLIAGLVAIGHSKPILACAAFGGAADKIWQALRAQYPLTPEQLAWMAEDQPSGERAARLVGLLKTQAEEFDKRAEARKVAEEQRLAQQRRRELQENSRINWHAVVSALLFGLAVFAWPATTFLDPKVGGFWPLVIVLATPMVSGASGATIRVVLDWALGVTRTFALSAYNQYILLRYCALGVVAGGLAGVSFVLAQVFATESQNGNPPSLARLVPFLIIIGFAAGLAAEVVLSNVRTSGEAVEVPVPPLKTS